MASSHAKPQRSERGINDMISKLTNRLVSLGQGTPEHDTNHHAPHNPDQGSRIVTLAGENKGASMKASGLDELVETQGQIRNDETLMSAYTNSNYQAVNNSIMLEGSYSADDPGVHIVIVENLDDDSSSDDSGSNGEDSDDGRKGKKGKKKETKIKKEGKKKEKVKKGILKEEHHSESEKEEKSKHSE